MDQKKFKSQERPAACSQPPWSGLIEPNKREEVSKKIKQECIEIYGKSYDECPKRSTCLSNSCIGRPLPWLSPTAQPYLEIMENLQNINENKELVLTNCDMCPIANKCTSTCSQMNDFINKNRVIEPEIEYRCTLNNIVVKSETISSINNLNNNMQKQLPWDAVSKLRKTIVEKHSLEHKNFATIGNELGISNINEIKYEFNVAMTILSEYGAFRMFLEKKGHTITQLQKEVLTMVYKDNITTKKASKLLGVSQRTVQKLIARVVEKHGIKWNIFVKKQKNKVIYSKQELLK